MGSITKEVEIQVDGRTKEHYESLGYIIPSHYFGNNKFLTVKKGTKITVNVHDLTPISNAKVDVECDGCHKVTNMDWYGFLRLHPVDNKYYCSVCYGKLFSAERQRLLSLKKGKSFEQWCIENNPSLLERWDVSNEFSPNEISCFSAKRFYFSCPLGIHSARDIMISNLSKSVTKDVICWDCHSLGFKSGECLDVWGDKNDGNPFDYMQWGRDVVWWFCENGIHDQYQRRIDNSVIYNFQCPKCVMELEDSKLQTKVRRYLEYLNYEHRHEKDCSLNPKNVIEHKTSGEQRLLRYDNEVVFSEINRLFIEVNGLAHYKLSGFHKLQADKYNTTPEYELWYQQAKDEYKKQYVLDHGYQFLEIPYTWDNKNEDWKHAIDDAINYCLSLE